MCGKQKFFICQHCGNLIGLIDNKGVPLVCCGDEMTELTPNTMEASVEKHLPVVNFDQDTLTVTIGSAPHPMIEAHHINFIYVETECGGQRKRLNVGEEAVQRFRFAEDKPVAAYAYCNLHGLWKTEL